MIDQYFPWRYQVVSSLQNGELPLWNPYNFSGYPIHADPQSGAWYPVVWLFSLFGAYTAKANAIEFFLHIWFAGIGMYLLVKQLYKNDMVALIAGLSYLGSGVLVGNAQHFTYVISACWIPFAVLYFVKFYTENTYKNGVLLSFFLWLLLTGGYPAFFIILSYILIIAFGLILIDKYRKKQPVIRVILTGFISAFVFVLLSLPSLISFALYWNDTTRSSGTSLADALFGAFRVVDVKSFFIPSLSALKQENTGTDLSMVNGYFGLIPLVGLGLAAFNLSKLNKLNRYVFLVSLICLLAAFGDTFFLPVRQWLYHLPGLSLFRFPAVFRLFSIVGFTILGAWGITQLNNKQFKWVVASVALIIILFIVRFTQISAISTDLKAYHFIWAEFPGSSSAAVLGGAIQLVCLVLLFFTHKRNIFWPAIAFLNVVLCTQMNVPTTVINKEPAAVIDDFLAKMPRDYNVQNNRLMGDTHFEAPAPLWRNLGVFYKQPSFDGNNPFRLNNFALAEKNDSIEIFKKMRVVETFSNPATINAFRSGYFNITIPTIVDTFYIPQNTIKYWKVYSEVTGLYLDLDHGVETPLNTFHKIARTGATKFALRYEPPFLYLSIVISITTLLGLLVGLYYFKQ